MGKLLDILREIESDKYQIYVDMDGVLTDFDKQLKATAGIKNGRDWEKKHGADAFWTEIKKGGLEFWSKMPWMKDGKQLWNYIKDKNVAVLSAPAKTIPDSKKGKKMWVKNNLGNAKLILAQAADKQKYASPTSILIDDFDRNISQWKASNGIAIHHKNASDTIKKLNKLFST